MKEKLSIYIQVGIYITITIFDETGSIVFCGIYDNINKAIKEVKKILRRKKK